MRYLDNENRTVNKKFIQKKSIWGLQTDASIKY